MLDKSPILEYAVYLFLYLTPGSMNCREPGRENLFRVPQLDIISSNDLKPYHLNSHSPRKESRETTINTLTGKEWTKLIQWHSNRLTILVDIPHYLRTMDNHVGLGVIDLYRKVELRESNVWCQFKSKIARDTQQTLNPTFRTPLVWPPAIPPSTFQLATILAGIFAECISSLSFTLLRTAFATVP